MGQSSTSIGAGLLVAALAAIPLLWSPGTKETSEAPVPDTVPVTTATKPAAAEEVVITTPPPQIEGLSESIARVLVVNGFAAKETTDELPETVVRTLAEHGIALTIAETG